MPRKSSTKTASASPRRSRATPGHKVPKPRLYTEEDLLKAVESCKPGNPERMSLKMASHLFGPPIATISNRLRGITAHKDAHQSQQYLTLAQEKVLAQYCRSRGWRRDPVDVAELQALVKQISGKDVGINWHLTFAKRHPGIKFRWAKRGEAKRASGLNRDNVKSFFTELKKAMDNIKVENIWNCDEKGLQVNGGVLRRRVLAPSEQKEAKISSNESRKMVTILECTNPVGVAIRPLIIHEGAEKDGEWVRNNPCSA